MQACWESVFQRLGDGELTTYNLLTIGDILRDERFKGLNKRRIEYAIEVAKIQPVGRAGIIRLFSPNQLPAILSSVERRASYQRFRVL